MALLARATPDELAALVESASGEPEYSMPRLPESGLCMVRGRMGGNGRRFNLGEASVTRCVVQLADNTTGVSYVLGRDKRKAELAAVADALLQNGALDRARLEALRRRIESGRQARAAAVASTRVDFFTLVRGED